MASRVTSASYLKTVPTPRTNGDFKTRINQTPFQHGVAVLEKYLGE